MCDLVRQIFRDGAMHNQNLDTAVRGALAKKFLKCLLVEARISRRSVACEVRRHPTEFLI
jgi:hypothetical protein